MQHHSSGFVHHLLPVLRVMALGRRSGERWHLLLCLFRVQQPGIRRQRLLPKVRRGTKNEKPGLHEVQSRLLLCLERGWLLLQLIIVNLHGLCQLVFLEKVDHELRPQYTRTRIHQRRYMNAAAIS